MIYLRILVIEAEYLNQKISEMQIQKQLGVIGNSMTQELRFGS